MTADSRINILLVDDVPGKLLALEAILDELGQNLVSVTSGREALRRLLHEDFAVILLDVSMPDMDGFETAALIRQRKRSEHTPIIFITAQADETHAPQGYSLGAVDYILAPVIPEVLRAKVNVFVELYRMHEQVRRQAEERVALAEEQALRMAAEKANRSKNEFLANISHELRTPMNAIIGMTELALEEDISPAARDYLGTVRSSAGALLALLNEILDVSRLEAGKFVLESAPFRLIPLVDETVKSLAVRACEKGLDVVVDCPVDLPDNVVGDSLRLRQVLVNLLGNAIKFTREGEVTLRLHVESESADQVTYLVSVSDTGIGIAPHDAERIFSPFTQADSSMSRAYGGTGLGLAIASELVQMMGGRLWVESQVGAGSTFHFTVRLRRAREAAPPVNDRAFDPAAPRLNRILVAETHQPTCRALSRMLSGWGLSAEIADSGRDAIERLETAAERGERFDVVLVDRMFPGTNGSPLVDELTARPALAGSVLLMISPTERQRSAEKHRTAPSLVILDKPVTHAELREALWNPFARVPTMSRLLPGVESAPRSAVSRRPLQILVAEDTPANQKLLTKILEKRGHSVTLASDGREAVALSGSGQYDLVLMDVQMPAMDGFRATSEIRSREAPGGPRIPIIALTAHAMQGDRERCLSAGMDGYISKPINVETLLAEIDERMAGLAPADSGAVPVPGPRPQQAETMET